MNTRASQKQKQLLDFIENFIKTTGYGPSYREVMRGLGYKSVSTVAIHIDNLIVKEYLKKADNEARSLELVKQQPVFTSTNTDWLRRKISKLEAIFKKTQQSELKNDIAILKKALVILEDKNYPS